LDTTYPDIIDVDTTASRAGGVRAQVAYRDGVMQARAANVTVPVEQRAALVDGPSNVTASGLTVAADSSRGGPA